MRGANEIPPRRTLSAQEAAERCGVSVPTLRRARDAGEIPARYVGEGKSKDLYRVEDLDYWTEHLPAERGGRYEG